MVSRLKYESVAKGFRVRTRGYPPGIPCWAELVSNDLTASIDFYSGLLGWRPVAGEHSTTFQIDDRAVAGATQAESPGRAPGWVTYISTDDIHACISATEAAGGTVAQKPTPVGTQGQIAMVTDSEGAGFALWQPGDFAGSQVVDEPGTVCWRQLMSRDTDKAIEFYSTAFGWTDQTAEVAPGITYHEWSYHNRALANMVAMGPEIPAQIPPHWSIIIEVADCAATADRCAELGGKITLPPMHVQIGDYAAATDPHGNPFSILSLEPGIRD